MRVAGDVPRKCAVGNCQPKVVAWRSRGLPGVSPTVDRSSCWQEAWPRTRHAWTCLTACGSAVRDNAQGDGSVLARSLPECPGTRASRTSGRFRVPGSKGSTCRMGSAWPLAESPGRALHTPGSASARCLETGEGFCLADGTPGRHADRGIACSSGDPLGCPRSIEAPGSRFSIRMRRGYGHAPSASGNWR